MRTILITGLLVLSLMLVSNTALAGVTNIAAAKILKVGARSNQQIVIVEGAPLASRTTFVLHPQNESRQLAIILTAYSLGKTLQMRVADTLNGSLLYFAYINE